MVMQCPFCHSEVPYGEEECRACHAKAEYGSPGWAALFLFPFAVFVAFFVGCATSGWIGLAAFFVLFYGGGLVANKALSQRVVFRPKR